MRAQRRPDGRRRLGRRGEQLAAAHLSRLGYSVLARNARTRAGEIDLIVSDGHVLVFVEVKSVRRSATGGHLLADGDGPLAGLRPRQRARLRRAAVRWMSEQGAQRPFARVVRFDAVGIVLDARGELLRLDHVEAAW